MRRRVVLLVVMLVVPLAALGLWVVVKSIRSSSNPQEAFGDSTLPQLPQDPKLAQKELRRARLALSRLKPSGPYIVIDTHSNTLSWRTEDSTLFKATCSTGSGGELIDRSTGRRWIFNTPRGVFRVNSKLKEPWWRKPDWAFIEENDKPPRNESERFDPEMLGECAMGFGSGYFIHGTIYERLLGVSVTHGCVRLGSQDLKYLYDRVRIGTPVYIF